jgi:hypothetical protein
LRASIGRSLRKLRVVTGVTGAIECTRDSARLRTPRTGIAVADARGVANKLLLFISIVLAGCGSVRAPAGGDDAGSGSDAGSDAPPKPDLGPHSHGFSAAGRRTTSAHFVLVSVTGQPTPVANGRSSSNSFVHIPGILGGQ